MTLFDRRLLAYKDDTAFERPSLLDRMCEYQRDIQDIERKWNKCNQILRRPLIPIRDRKKWIDSVLESGVGPRRDKELLVREIQAAQRGEDATKQDAGRSRQQEESVGASQEGVSTRHTTVRQDSGTPAAVVSVQQSSTVNAITSSKTAGSTPQSEQDPRKSIAVSQKMSDVTASKKMRKSSRKSVASPKDLGESSGPISLRVFRLKKLDYPGMSKCEYVVRAKYKGSTKEGTETTAKPSETGILRSTVYESRCGLCYPATLALSRYICTFALPVRFQTHLQAPTALSSNSYSSSSIWRENSSVKWLLVGWLSHQQRERPQWRVTSLSTISSQRMSRK